MNYTLAGMIALIIIILLLIKIKGKIYLLPTIPLFWICFNFFSYFGHYKTIKFPLFSELLLLLSFIVFIVFYFFSKKIKNNKIIKLIYCLKERKNSEGSYLLKKKVFYSFVFIVFFYCIFDLWLNTKIYGSLDAALTRFYAKSKVDDVPNILIIFQNFIIQFIISFIFIFRFFQNRNNKKTFLIYIPVILLIFISFSKGSRGATVEPIFMIILADFFSKKFDRNFSFLNKLIEYSILGFSALCLIFSLTFIRGINFNDLMSLQESLKNFKLNQGVEKFDDEETDLMIKDTKFVFDNFGEKYPYLGLFYTIKSIIFNPLPRFIYPNKPIAFGVLLTEAKFGTGDFRTEHLNSINTGYAVGVAGEGWANLGLIGLIVYSIIMGMYSGFFTRLFQEFISSDNYLLVLFSILSFKCTSNFIRGDLHSGILQGIYPIVVFFIFVFIFYKRKKGNDSFSN